MPSAANGTTATKISPVISSQRSDERVTPSETPDELDYASVKCRDPDGYIVEASWEPEQ